MTITREQVADLQPGDVVELRDDRWPEVVIRGPVRITENGDSYAVGELGISPAFLPEFRQPYNAATRTLTVVSRAPRPLYVNHPRTEPAGGDVARDADGDLPGRVWVYAGIAGTWRWAEHPSEAAGQLKDVRLRLLVDGETGQVVTP
jgi:hypothetical protein